MSGQQGKLLAFCVLALVGGGLWGAQEDRWRGGGRDEALCVGSGRRVVGDGRGRGNKKRTK